MDPEKAIREMWKVPVVLNAFQVSREIAVPRSRVYKALSDGTVKPDFCDLNGNGLVRATRLAKIANLLQFPEVVS